MTQVGPIVLVTQVEDLQQTLDTLVTNIVHRDLVLEWVLLDDIASLEPGHTGQWLAFKLTSYLQRLVHIPRSISAANIDRLS